MNITNLKGKTIKYILTRTNLDEDERIQLINFVEEATEHQVMHLLISGRMSEDSNVPKVIEEQYNKYDVETKLNEIAIVTGATLIAMLAIVGVGAIIAGASEIFLYAISKSYRICNKYNIRTKEFLLCGEKVTLDGYEKKLNFLKDKISLCSKAEDPKKCNLKVKEAIKKTEKKIKETNKKLKQLEKEVKDSEHGKY